LRAPGRGFTEQVGLALLELLEGRVDAGCGAVVRDGDLVTQIQVDGLGVCAVGAVGGVEDGLLGDEALILAAPVGDAGFGGCYAVGQLLGFGLVGVLQGGELLGGGCILLGLGFPFPGLGLPVNRSGGLGVSGLWSLRGAPVRGGVGLHLPAAEQAFVDGDDLGKFWGRGDDMSVHGDSLG